MLIDSTCDVKLIKISTIQHNLILWILTNEISSIRSCGQREHNTALRTGAFSNQCCSIWNVCCVMGLYGGFQTVSSFKTAEHWALHSQLTAVWNTASPVVWLWLEMWCMSHVDYFYSHTLLLCSVYTYFYGHTILWYALIGKKLHELPLLCLTVEITAYGTRTTLLCNFSLTLIH